MKVSSLSVHLNSSDVVAELCFEYLDKAIALNPDDIDSLIKRATLMMEKGLTMEAIGEFEKLEKNSTALETTDLWYHRGQLKFLSGQFGPAVVDYKKAIELDPEFIYGHIQLAVAQYKAGDIGECERGFRRAQKLFENRSEIYHYHGEVLADQQNIDVSEKMFDKAIETDPSNPLPLMNKGTIPSCVIIRS